nr:unnamed protein product [Spirometra erinaceieuropaei]
MTSFTTNDPTPYVPQPSITSNSISSTATSATTTNSPTPAASENTLDDSLTTTLTIIILTAKDVDSIPACPHCDRALTPDIGLVDNMRTHPTLTDVLVPAVPTH